MTTTDEKPERNYCLFMDGSKYNRNAGCKAHDNAYGIYGGGGERDRARADWALFRHMRAQRDPLAFVALYFTRVYGWWFFNYHGFPWRGQLSARWAAWRMQRKRVAGNRQKIK